jgi:adenosylcobinamide-GDP ribazoletransferase
VRRAFSFLTRLPGGRGADSAAELAASVGWFPAVGAAIGLLGGIGYLAAGLVAPPLVAAGFALAVTAATTGALHEDGLADTVDALPGGRDVEDRRRILRDSRHGTFGVLALVLITVAKAGSLAELDGELALTALIMAHSLARTGTVVLLGVARPAPGPGSGRSLAEQVTPGVVAMGATAGLVVAALGMGLAASSANATGVEAAVAAGAALAGVAGTAGAVTWWARRRIGGVTGDVLGAAEQAGELAVLVALSSLAS